MVALWSASAHPDPKQLNELFTDIELNVSLAAQANTAPGPDSISAALLKHTDCKFRECLLFMCNLSWSTGALPACWKTADVCPIYKGNGADPNLPKSWRPISLTLCIVKTFERMIAVRLVDILEGRNFFSRWQAGFRHNHSALDQVYRLIDRVQQAFAAQDYVSVAFLDVVAAFDTVWIDGLLYKLHRAGVSGRAWQWIRCFLSARTFRVVSGSTSSDEFTLGAGVPQGSILGPLLFLVYINDIPTSSSVEVALFADDIVAWSVHDGAYGDRQLNHFLAKLHAWSVEWHVVFSMPKSGHMCFHRPRTEAPTPTSLVIGSGTLPIVHKYRYLGLLFVPTLSWRVHGNQAISRAFNAASRVASILTPSGPPPRLIRQLVQSVVLPAITYGFPLWQPTTKQQWSKLEAAVCLPLRCSLGLPISAQRLALLAEFGIVGPRLQYERSALVFAHRAHVKLAPPQLTDNSVYARNQAPPPHTTHALFTRQRLQRLEPHTPRHSIPFGKAVKTVEHFWDTEHTHKDCASSRSLTYTALSKQVKLIRNAPKPSRYADLDPKAQPTYYIMHDDRLTAILRARIRLNRHHFRARQHKLGLEPSPDCPVCQVPETAHHVLFDCVRFDLARQRCLAALSFFRVPSRLFSLSYITGDFGHVSKGAFTDVLHATGRFLHEVNRRCGI